MNERQGPETDRATANIWRQRRFWTARAAAWDHGVEHNPGLVRVIEAVIERANPCPTTRAVDLGCGSGQLALRLAPLVDNVLAVDISPAMIRLLEANAAAASVTNIACRTVPVEHLDLAPGSVDLIVSNYALHHLRDADKATVVCKAAEWLAPGGRLVIGDMMFGRGGDARDRAIISSKVAALARRGPAGWWRITKNASRYLFRLQERPISMQAWADLFAAAGFSDVESVPVVAEAAVVTGRNRGAAP